MTIAGQKPHDKRQKFIFGFPMRGDALKSEPNRLPNVWSESLWLIFPPLR